MIITVQRVNLYPTCTIGWLFVDGRFECFTLEDTVRADGVKVQGQTAIPAGKYEVVVDMSTRFKRLMPHILDVPQFTGIRMHSGLIPEHTEGCPLVGDKVEFVPDGKRIVSGTTIPAFDRLFVKIQYGILRGGCQLDIA